VPANLFPRSIVAKNQQRRAAGGLRARREVTTNTPWEGLTNDLPHTNPDLKFVKSTVGLVAKSSPIGGGEVLMNDVGFTQVDSSTADNEELPLGSANGTVVVWLGDFPLVDNTLKVGVGDEDLKSMALVAGDGTTAGSFLVYELAPSSANWTLVGWVDPVNTTGTAVEPSGTRDGETSSAGNQPYRSMPDATVFFPGTATRTSADSFGGAIDKPCFIWTNNVDPVMIYPEATTGVGYQQITDTLGHSSDSSDFRCVSLETWGDRVYFFNTREGSGANAVRHRQRLRRTARGDCDPDPANDGAGFIDLETFEGNGVRIEGLGNTLVAYFQDGIAFIHETGLLTAPNRVQVINTHRGLLGTHSMCQVGDQAHFGIFNDGWWFLDASGRFQEAGVVSLDGKAVEKWRRTFDELVDQKNLHRLHCHYDQGRNWVRIVVPEPADEAGGLKETTKTWIYDIDANRVWTLDYPESLAASGGVTLWSSMTLRDAAATTWASLEAGANPTWSSIDPDTTWGDLAPTAGDKVLAHANHLGYIFNHSEDLIKYNGNDPSWSYEVVPTDFGSPRTLKTVDQLSVEHINSQNSNAATLTVTTGRSTVTASSSIDLNTSATSGDIEIASSHYRVNDEHVGFSVSGSGAIRIRSFGIDLFEKPVRRRI
jgi:hypothetical protein